jgi:hypothetical protein
VYADFESGGDLLYFFGYLRLPDNGHAILKADAVHHVRQLLKTPYPTPAFFRTVGRISEASSAAETQSGISPALMLSESEPAQSKG